jgi:hypothetical protein
MKRAISCVQGLGRFCFGNEALANISMLDRWSKFSGKFCERCGNRGFQGTFLLTLITVDHHISLDGKLSVSGSLNLDQRGFPAGLYRNL